MGEAAVGEVGNDGANESGLVLAGEAVTIARTVTRPSSDPLPPDFEGIDPCAWATCWTLGDSGPP